MSSSAIFRSLERRGTLFCPPSFPCDFMYSRNPPFSRCDDQGPEHSTCDDPYNRCSSPGGDDPNRQQIVPYQTEVHQIPPAIHGGKAFCGIDLRGNGEFTDADTCYGSCLLHGVLHFFTDDMFAESGDEMPDASCYHDAVRIEGTKRTVSPMLYPHRPALVCSTSA